MSQEPAMTRRAFLRLATAAGSGLLLAACGSAGQAPAGQGGTAAPAADAPTTSAPATSAPAAASGSTVRIAVGAWAEQGMKDLLANTGFTEKTGISYEVLLRSDTKETELAKLTSAVQANTTPYDILDFEDELATSFSQAGYMLPLNDLLPADFWDDFPQVMKENHDVWSTRDGELFRVLHNWEAPYWFYRKDWFDEQGVAVPTTWDEVRALGPVFTDESTGVWASEDGLIKGAFLNVYLAWLSVQAGGSPFDLGDPYRESLQYAYDLMHGDKVLNPASLQKDYNQQNADYIADKVAFMRQWPFLYDVVRSDENKGWFTSEDKLAVALPPAGPAGGLTYGAGWGFGIVKNSPNLEAAKEMFRFLIDKEAAVEAVKASYWFLSARTSVLEAAGGEGVAGLLQMYTDANAIALRPYHPRFVQALTIIEDTAAAFLTDQVSLDDALAQAQSQLDRLA
jgi:multiple sugar transport system substrate-binding protein